MGAERLCGVGEGPAGAVSVPDSGAVPVGHDGEGGAELGLGLAGWLGRPSRGKFFLTQTNEKIKQKQIKYYIGILYIKIFRKRFSTR